eukprot:CAMPEP_0194206906 /NCGR_PEP_ID=MMETSP0156-20130528/5809_1 /TAXON_ID=33649 /ORGANISM="Thalassionema nitzschioides, Strain L26-B" /LENGTH=437 /DNA_ID=CAMNT_0038933553 /DNA_START=45 /DNA_END=1355 /DNA_ORIENTATION=-
MRANLFLWLLLQQLFEPVFPFADILKEPNGCMTELDTSEVIMNSPIQAFEDSKDPDVQITVQSDGSETTVLESPIMITSVPTSFIVKMMNPNNVASIQFAMDVVGPTGSAHWEMGACDDKKRLTSTVSNKGYKLIIDKIPDKTIEIVAGWATGHEAVSLTNVLEFKSSNGNLDTPNGVEIKQKADLPKSEEAVDEVVEGIINQVKEMEHAEENEREQEQQYLGDDDAVNVGDVEQQLDNVHADAEMKKRLERFFEQRAEGGKEHSGDGTLMLPDFNKLKERMQEKPRDNAQKENGAKIDFSKWDIAREKLEKDMDFARKKRNFDENKEFAERKRLMIERREKIIHDKNPSEALSNKLKDLGQRDDRWKKHLQTQREMLSAKSKAPLPNDESSETQEEGNEEDPPYKRRMREIYEEQDSDIVFKEVLIGLLGVLIANW